MMYSVGWRVHADRPASASDAPMIFRKLRRPSSSIHSEAWRGNSRCRNSWKPSRDVSSSRLRQYPAPFACSSRCRIDVKLNSPLELSFEDDWPFSVIRLLSVTCPTRLQFLNVIFLHQPRAQLFLRFGRLISHGRD